MTNIYDDHRYLYHYTDFTGLKGILETKTLWATHYKALNDFSEVEHMRSALEELTFKIVNPVMRKKAKSSFAYKRHLEKHGGLAASSRWEAKNIVNIFYEITFEGRKGGEPFAEPYVVSFCAHTNATNYVKEHGLLSMWRAYGEAGGFALVFDTKRLWELLSAEIRHYGYSAFYMADVVYDDEEERFKTEFGDLIRVFEEFVDEHAKGLGYTHAGKAFAPFFNAVTRYKHQGFKEEHEVRLTASPIPEAIYKSAQVSEGKDIVPKVDIKPIMTREKRGVGTKYIILNDVPTKKTLPIVKIIVGPQHDQKRRAQDVRKLLGGKNIDIVCSETPFIPA